MKITDFPFFWQVKSAAEPHQLIPDDLPYEFEVDSSTGLVKQVWSNKLDEILQLMYQQEANIGFLQEGHTLAESYGQDFLNVLKEFIITFGLRSSLEIGCGGCYLLKRISELGIDSYGLDPSPIASARAKEMGLDVLTGFYPDTRLTNKYDLIYHVDVLEHIADPISFLSSHKNNLTNNGLVIVNVPDAGESIQKGDVSVALHQHLNNFDELSLFNTLISAGFYVLDIRRSAVGASLYAVASPNQVETSINFLPAFDKLHSSTFITKAQKNLLTLQNQILDLSRKNKNIGFYVPLRAFPYVYSSGITEYRIFDDMSHWHNGYIGSCTSKIENYDDLMVNPVDVLFIMSYSFGASLKRKISSQHPNMSIYLLDECLDY